MPLLIMFCWEWTYAITYYVLLGMGICHYLLCLVGNGHMPLHSCQPLLGINLSPEFVNLYFCYAGWGLLFFRWYQRHFEFQSARVAVEGRSNVVLNMHAQLQISLLMRFLTLLH